MDMDPISNQVFSHDYIKFVYQDPDARFVKPPPTKPFEIKGPEKSKKTKKDMDKKKEQGGKKNP